MMSKTAIFNMIEKTESVGWLHYICSRTLMGPDRAGLRKILDAHPEICYVRVIPAPMGFGYKEDFYSCNDTSLSKDGRQILEDMADDMGA